MSNTPPTPSNAPPSFSIQDLHWANAWSETAPGYGGWGTAVDVDDEAIGEIMSVFPPCSDDAAFVIVPGAGGTVGMSILLGGMRRRSHTRP